MQAELKQITNAFQLNLDKIETLLTFDKSIRDLCLRGLKKAKKGLDRFAIDNPAFSVDLEIDIIEKLHLSELLKPNYQIMYNQCVVLLVSYFSSAVEDIFKVSFYEKLTPDNVGELESEEIKITIGQFMTGDDMAGIFVQKKDDISFQDMKSILRSFVKYIGLSEIERNQAINNIILAQAMRHCIVHSGCVINDKTINQLRDAKPRTVKRSLTKGRQIQFYEDEVRQIKNDMLSFVNLLSSNILGTFGYL